MACRTGCPTQDHENWGACVRAAGLQWDLHGIAGHRNLERDKEKRLGTYEDLRREGLQPKNTTWEHIRDTQEHGGVPPTPVDVAA